MARKPTAKKTVTDDQIIDAALDLAATKGWAKIGMAAISEAAGVSVADLYVRFPSKAAVLTAFIRRVDGQVLAGAGNVDKDGSATDRLFDVLMARFDALAPHKAAVRSILKGMPEDPLAALCALPQLRRSFKWMLVAAGLPAEGVRGEIVTKAVLGVWLNAVRVWLKDDDPDLSRTMAVLDRNLKRAAQWGCFVQRRRSDDAAAQAA